MKKISFCLMLCVVTVFSFYFISNVNAYEENAFTDGKCITSTDWQKKATVGYVLDNTGIYKSAEKTYEEYKAAEDGSELVFYMPSDDGKLLYSFVPNYSSVISAKETRDEIFNKGIVTTASCDGTFVSVKTVIGNPPSDSSYINFDESNTGGANNKNTDGTSNTESIDNNESNNYDTQKLDSPNTASPMAISIIIVSLALIFISIYCLNMSLKKNKK